MSQSDLLGQLTQLQAAIQQTAQLILKLAKAQSVDDGSSEGVSEIAADIRENLHQQEEELELLKQDVDDLVGHSVQTGRRAGTRHTRSSSQEQEYARLHGLCMRLDEDLHTQRARFRRAHLQAKKNEEQALAMEQEAYLADLRAAANNMEAESMEPADKNLSTAETRTSLFANRRGGARSNPNQTKDDLLLSTSSDLTSSLRRTHEMLTSELSRSRFAQETLETSNSALKELNQRYGTLDDLLSRSRGLLGTLLRSQKSDTWFLETTMWMLMITIGWLVFRRLLYGPLWWLAWVPLKFAYNIIALIVGSKARAALVPSKMPTFRSPTVVQMVQDSSGPSMSASVEDDDSAVRRALRGSMNEAVGRIIDASQTVVGATHMATAAPQATEGSEESSGEGLAREQIGEGEQPASRDRSAAGDEGPQQVRRADGTVLRERDPVKEPANPKKRMFEDPPQPQQQRDEL